MPDSIMPRQTMSGLDFPANPNVGDVFMGWTWDGTKWIRTPVIPPAQLMVSVGPSPPGSPADGFLWWDSVGGNLYMWYVDATSSQWVIANVGIMGPTGAQGPPGPAVPAVILQPSVPTASDLPTTGNTAGDARITVDTGDLWVWDGTVWFNAGPIQGPPGVAGAPGPQGPAGPPGPVGEAPTDGQYYVRQGSTASWSVADYLPLTGGTINGSLVINQNSVTPPGLGTAYLQPTLWVSGSNSNGIMIDGWSGIQAGGGSIQFRCQGGTPAAPAATAAANIGGFNFNGWTGTAWGSGGGASFGAWAPGTWSPTSQPGAFSIYGTAVNSTTQTEMLQLTTSGHTFFQNVAGPTFNATNFNASGGMGSNNGFTAVFGTWMTGMYSQGAGGPLQFGGYAAVGSWDANAWYGGFDANGNLTIKGTLTQNSDQRSKRNIADADDGLAVVQQMQPKRYERIAGGEIEMGFIAQDIQALLPEAVHQRNNDMLGLEVMPLIAVLVNAVKELNAKLEALS